MKVFVMCYFILAYSLRAISLPSQVKPSEIGTTLNNENKGRRYSKLLSISYEEDKSATQNKIEPRHYDSNSFRHEKLCESCDSQPWIPVVKYSQRAPKQIIYQQEDNDVINDDENALKSYLSPPKGTYHNKIISNFQNFYSNVHTTTQRYETPCDLKKKIYDSTVSASSMNQNFYKNEISNELDSDPKFVQYVSFVKHPGSPNPESTNIFTQNFPSYDEHQNKVITPIRNILKSPLNYTSDNFGKPKQYFGQKIKPFNSFKHIPHKQMPAIIDGKYGGATTKSPHDYAESMAPLLFDLHPDRLPKTNPLPNEKVILPRFLTPPKMKIRNGKSQSFEMFSFDPQYQLSQVDTNEKYDPKNVISPEMSDPSIVKTNDVHDPYKSHHISNMEENNVNIYENVPPLLKYTTRYKDDYLLNHASFYGDYEPKHKEVLQNKKNNNVNFLNGQTPSHFQRETQQENSINFEPENKRPFQNTRNPLENFLIPPIESITERNTISTSPQNNLQNIDFPERKPNQIFIPFNNLPTNQISDYSTQTHDEYGNIPIIQSSLIDVNVHDHALNHPSNIGTKQENTDFKHLPEYKPIEDNLLNHDVNNELAVNVFHNNNNKLKNEYETQSESYNDLNGGYGNKIKLYDFEQDQLNKLSGKEWQCFIMNLIKHLKQSKTGQYTKINKQCDPIELENFIHTHQEQKQQLLLQQQQLLQQQKQQQQQLNNENEGDQNLNTERNEHTKLSTENYNHAIHQENNQGNSEGHSNYQNNDNENNSNRNNNKQQKTSTEYFKHHSSDLYESIRNLSQALGQLEDYNDIAGNDAHNNIAINNLVDSSGQNEPFIINYYDTISHSVTQSNEDSNINKNQDVNEEPLYNNIDNDEGSFVNQMFDIITETPFFLNENIDLQIPKNYNDSRENLNYNPKGFSFDKKSESKPKKIKIVIPYRRKTKTSRKESDNEIQESIDTWTANEYSNHKHSSLKNSDFNQTRHLNALQKSKTIPLLYLPMNSPKKQPLQTTTRTTTVILPSTTSLTSTESSAKQSSDIKLNEGNEQSNISGNDSKSWEELTVAISPYTKERVYVVTPKSN